MRYSIFDFNQQLCAELGLTVNDLLLLDYIQKAIANPKMKHSSSDPLCVWLYHQKILNDLPILNISESTLKKWLKNLVDKGLLKRETVHSKSYGMKAYYGVTDKLIELQISQLSQDTWDSKPQLMNELRDVKPQLIQDTPDSKLVKKDKILNKTIIKNNNSRKLVKNKSLYECCIDMISVYTKDKPGLEPLLVQYLKMRLEIKDKPLYKNQWKGILNKLDKIHEEEGQSYKDIVQFNIEKGYASFFPIPAYNKPSKKKDYNDKLSNEQYTEEERKQIKKWQKEQIAKGERIVF